MLLRTVRTRTVVADPSAFYESILRKKCEVVAIHHLLDYYAIPGSIPPRLGDLRALERLDLGSNRLSGEIRCKCT